MKEKLLKLLSENARLSEEQLAVMLDTDAGAIRREIQACEEQGIIKGYNALIDWEKVDKDMIEAFIELKITPQPDLGFDDIAKRVMEYPEVETVYLMSGGYDLSLTVRGRSFKEVALFVAEHLAPMEQVESTVTHFVLRRYKDRGVVCIEPERDERRPISLC